MERREGREIKELVRVLAEGKKGEGVSVVTEGIGDVKGKEKGEMKRKE